MQNCDANPFFPTSNTFVYPVRCYSVFTLFATVSLSFFFYFHGQKITILRPKNRVLLPYYYYFNWCCLLMPVLNVKFYLLNSTILQNLTTSHSFDPFWPLLETFILYPKIIKDIQQFGNVATKIDIFHTKTSNFFVKTKRTFNTY